MDKVWTAEEIKEKLLSDDFWVKRAVAAIYKYQTRTEQSIEATTDRNNVGFNGARMVG